MPKRYGKARSRCNLAMQRITENDRKEMETFQQWLREHKALVDKRNDPNVDDEVFLQLHTDFDAKWGAYENGKSSGPSNSGVHPSQDAVQ